MIFQNLSQNFKYQLKNLDSTVTVGSILFYIKETGGKLT
jgi:hypothetical protein